MAPLPPSLAVLAVLLALTGGCSRGAGGDRLPPDSPNGGTGQAPAPFVTALSLVPPDAVLVTTDAASATVTWTVQATLSDGSERDVSERAAMLLDDPALGQLSGTTFIAVPGRGGSTRVTANVDGIRSSAGLEVRLQRTFLGIGVDPALGSAFDGPADPARAPRLVYPNDGVVLPPNLRALELHWLPGSPANALFELSFTNALTSVRVLLRCERPFGGGCIYLPDDDVWRALAETNRGGSTVTVGLRATDDAGTGVGTAASLSLSFTEDDLLGAVYYWRTTRPTAVLRYDFAGSQSSAEVFVASTETGGTCVGCHALSRDGRTLVAEAGGQNDGRLLLFDAARRTPLVPFDPFAFRTSTFESWNPDGSQFVGVYGDARATDFNLLLFDGRTGQRVGDIPATGTQAHPADHPDWSVDGTRIAYVQVGRRGTLQRMHEGAIAQVIRGGGGWNAPEVLVPSVVGTNRYYPAWSPDGSFLVFDESTCPVGQPLHRDCNADTDPSARLFAVVPDAGVPIALSRANARGPLDPGPLLASSFPKWSPFLSKRAPGVPARIQWLSFSSTRRYGLRTPPPATGENRSGTWLWMVAIDPDALAAGADPSFPAFALPFQDLATSNHIAQWTSQVPDACAALGQACGPGAECCAGFQCTGGSAGQACGVVVP